MDPCALLAVATELLLPKDEAFPLKPRFPFKGSVVHPAVTSLSFISSCKVHSDVQHRKVIVRLAFRPVVFSYYLSFVSVTQVFFKQPFYMKRTPRSCIGCLLSEDVLVLMYGSLVLPQ